MKTSTFRSIMVFLVVIGISASFEGQEDVIDTGVSILQPLDAQDELGGEDADITTEQIENGNDEQDIDNEVSLIRNEEEERVDREENNNDGNSSPPLELGTNETMSLNDYITEDKAQNSQNLTDIHSVALVATTSNNTNNASSGEHYNINGSVIEEATFNLKCHPSNRYTNDARHRKVDLLYR
jgi:hypothetical protein